MMVAQYVITSAIKFVGKKGVKKIVRKATEELAVRAIVGSVSAIVTSNKRNLCKKQTL